MTKTAIEMIQAERERQVHVLGYTAEHDDQYTKGQIAWAACDFASTGTSPGSWSWANHKAKHSRIEQLAIAGALIVAEIERLQRAEGKEPPKL